jgi:hypothetical protein
MVTHDSNSDENNGLTSCWLRGRETALLLKQQ